MCRTVRFGQNELGNWPGRASLRVAAPCDSFDLYVTFHFRYVAVVVVVAVVVGEHFLSLTAVGNVKIPYTKIPDTE